jgi:Ca-activated chloride channel homolog
MEWPPLPPGVKETLERLAFALWFAGVCVLLYLTLQAQLARAAEFPKDIGAGTLLFESGDGFDPAAPLSTDVRMSVAGVVARVSVAQRFRNPGGNWAEAVYAFPLPDDAAVDRLLMKIGERVIEGEIHEREQAERIFGTARAAGQRASLVRQDTPNLFTTAVANIAPGESIDITIEYFQTARYDAGELSLRLPMTITPRYGSGDTPEQERPSVLAAPPPVAFAAHDALGAGLGDTGGGAVRNEASLRVILAPGLPLAAVGARGHDVSVLRQSADGTALGAADDLAAGSGGARIGVYDYRGRGGFDQSNGGGGGFDTSSGAGGSNPAASRNAAAADRYVIEPTTRTVPMDRDFVLAWRPQLGSEPAVAALTETKGETTYALLMIVPPSAVHASRTQPREMIYVIDTSGSMGGQSIEQAKLALKDALGRLTGADRFNIFQFNSWTSSLYRAPAALTSETYAQAVQYVDGLESTGGTEMEPAIRAALSQPVTAGYMRQVIFLTDGAVAGETTLFTAIKDALGDARLFTIGIGSAPNSHFMRKAAQFGRGTFTHIAKESEIASAMGSLLDKIERVALTDVLLDWPDAVEIYPNQVPDLYAGEPLVVTASFAASDGKPLTVEAFGRVAGVSWSQRVTAPTDSLPGIAALWARRKIEYLTDSRVDGANEALIRKLVVDVALEHGLVSPYTSLVAVDKTPARTEAAALERKAVGNAPPQGARFTTLPQTATPAPLYRWLGICVLLIAATIGAAGLRRPRFAL